MVWGRILGGKSLSVGPVVGCPCKRVAIPSPDESPEHRGVWLLCAPGPQHPKMRGIQRCLPPINCHVGLCAGLFCPQVRFGASSKEQLSYIQGEQTEMWAQPSGVRAGRPQGLSLSNAPLGTGIHRHYDFQCV